ncbi:PREDICTED: rootletin-like [Tinamus guttatus]|uniref:rootletin-like n=1 Tax=Tinamus guttatus TaxID=94827 RepID=UPI00052F0D1C|nr:PREDICTED: rootletin-like [Tinamus guttatus]
MVSLSFSRQLESREPRVLSEQDHGSDLENTRLHLEDEKQRSAGLSQMNSLLREQLEQIKSSNQRLAAELEQATVDVHRLRGELEQCHHRESSGPSWRSKHGETLLLWHQAATLRGHFMDLRAVTERGLAEAKIDMAKLARRLHTACLNLDSNLRLSQSHTTCSLEKESLHGAQLEQQLRDKVREMIELQSHWDGEKVELNSRIAELSLRAERLQEQNMEKEESIAHLKLDIEKLVRPMGLLHARPLPLPMPWPSRASLPVGTESCHCEGGNRRQGGSGTPLPGRQGRIGRELQRHRALLEEQKEELASEWERSRKELERGQQSLEQLEEKASALKKELLAVTETLSQATLAREVLEGEKACLGGALRKAEATCAKLELALNTMQLEGAELRDSLAKMAALNEGLAR